MQISSFVTIDAKNVTELLGDLLRREIPEIPEVAEDTVEKIPEESDKIESFADESIPFATSKEASVDLKEVKFD